MISQNPSVRHICRFVWCWRVCLPLFLYLFMSFSFIQEAEGTKRPEFRERRSYIHGRWRAWCKSKKAKLTVSDFLVWRSCLSFFLSFLFLLRFRARKNYSNRHRSRNRNYSSTTNRSENGTLLRRNISCIDWNLMENGKKLLIRISYPSFIKESFLIREIFF